MDGGGGSQSGAVQTPGQDQAQGGGGRSGWQILRSILFQIVIFYFITSFFRGRQQPPPAHPEGSHPAAGRNLFPRDQDMVRINWVYMSWVLASLCIVVEWGGRGCWLTLPPLLCVCVCCRS